MYRRTSLAIGGLVALIVGAIMLYQPIKPSRDMSLMAASAQSDAAGETARIAVAALGRIEPESEIIDIGSAHPDRLEKLTVARGDQVKASQILGYLEGYSERVAEREELAMKLREARELLTAELAFHRAQIRAATLRLQQIRAVRPLEIEIQEAKIRSLKADLHNNRDILSSRKALLKRHAHTRRATDDQRTIVLKNIEELKSAEAELAKQKANFELDILKTENEIHRNEASLARAKVRTSIDSLEQSLKLADERVKHATIRAPIDGEILNILKWPGERVDSQPILKMGNTRACLQTRKL